MNYGYPAYLNPSWAEAIAAGIQPVGISTRPPTDLQAEMDRAAQEQAAEMQAFASSFDAAAKRQRRQQMLIGLAVGIPLFSLAAYGMRHYWQGT